MEQLNAKLDLILDNQNIIIANQDELKEELKLQKLEIKTLEVRIDRYASLCTAKFGLKHAGFMIVKNEMDLRSINSKLKNPEYLQTLLAYLKAIYLWQWSQTYKSI